MNDNRVRRVEWQREVGAFFAPRMGSTPAAWAEANLAVIIQMLTPAAWQVRLHTAADFASFQRAYHLDWLRAMCEHIGVPMPPDAEALALVAEAEAAIMSRVQSAFPGAVTAIRTLHAGGYRLYTASGESSVDLAHYLTPMGVRECFQRLYGPDLINTFKIGPDFYARLLADAGVAPSAALVVDDTLQALEWAAQLGARTVLVGADPPPAFASPHHHLRALADLPALLAQLEE